MTQRTANRQRRTGWGRALGAAVAAAMAFTGTALPAFAADAVPEGEVNVEKVEGLGSDFIAGADFSSLLSEEESGVTYRNPQGQTQDAVTILRNAGVNYARVRVWNDPFDADGNGYGAGNVDVNRAIQIGKRATAAGMKVLVDFHYSDFWPDGQPAPKAWKQYVSEPDKMAQAVHDFTKESLEKFKAAGVDVGMVQVGNESNNKITGISGADNMAKIYKAGSQAVREVYPETDANGEHTTKVALHFNQKAKASWADNFEQQGIDYDVFAMSFYAWGSTTIAQVANVLKTVAKTHHKDVMIAETAWPYQIADTDGYKNNYGPHNADKLKAYPVSAQGQADNIHDVAAAVNGIGDNDGDGHDDGLGFFYWEPAWIAVGPADTPEQIEANREKWRKYGSGWISEYAKGYYKSGGWAGTTDGSGWDNMALFDAKGNALGSLQAFNYIRTGAAAPHTFLGVEDTNITVAEGEPVTLPQQVTLTYKDGKDEQENVTWRKSLDWAQGSGTFTVTGVTASGHTAKAVVTVTPTNHLANPSFEDDDMTKWAVTLDPSSEADAQFLRKKSGNSSDGSYGLYYWSGKDGGAGAKFSATQTVTGLKPGTYQLTATVRGTDMSDTDAMTLKASADGKDYSNPMTAINTELDSTATVTNIVVGESGTVTVTLDAALAGGLYGTIDDFTLTQASKPEGMDGLNAAITKAEGIDRDGYTAESLTKLDEAVEIAKVVAAGSAATSESIAKATTLVNEALDALASTTPTPDPDPDPEPTPDPTPGPGTDTQKPGSEDGSGNGSAGEGSGGAVTAGPKHKTDGTKELSRTGATVALVAAACGLSAMAGFVLMVWRRRRSTR
ncbi:glycosyl hydrolase 53 family protein [Bifidobacterium saguinibicoloris]|uniref:glycosyl hydrolase 53 family protein n=1 Tax=Bifidobacterium saguinibicoloris TaxID=2834433 RepID=UPI001C58EA05|nr:glycosyl hydrolase 53 family protein [Bifidobacterium saguinibicoloris]MBW3080160.1 glycosyl hydrolase 53 family protein [Bifidobacterium saguinibicoloris]